jgi:Tol biopolymer transport system component
LTRMTRDRLQIVEELFEEALRLPPERRAEALARACGSDADLLQEVESLLAAAEETEGFIETSAYNLFADAFGYSEIQSLEGKQIGHYHVLSMLGRGGMGEVYLAEDNVLGRKVAIKALPPNPGASVARLERFVREARAASALNHPNIITIHEIGRFEDSHYIAEEFVEGQTLRERITGPLIDIAVAIDVAIQVSQALSASHDAGIVHRDIKPENIMLRPDGVVKVLDFGLAKFTETAAAKMTNSSGAFGANSADETLPGTVMGTVTYMSPEQARGTAIDGRTDIFSLGVVLYEMLCGRPPFKGETPSDTIAEILKSEPKPLAEVTGNLPAGLESIVDKALCKDVSARYQSAREMLSELRTVDPKKIDHKTPPGKGRRLIEAAASVLHGGRLLTVVIVILAAALIWALKRSGGEGVIKAPSATHRIPIFGWKMDPGGQPHTGRFSPDGKAIAMSLTKNGNGFISIKQVAGGDPVQLTDGQSNETSPVWSPDGQEIAYVSRGTRSSGVWSIPASGGSPLLLEQLAPGAPTPRLIRWSGRSHRIYYEYSRNLFAFDLDSKKSTQLTKFDASKFSPPEFSLSPDESWTSYTDNSAGHFDVWVQPLQGGASRKLTDDPDEARFPEWLPDNNRLVYSSKRDGVFQVYLAFLDGRNPVQLTFGDTAHEVCDVSQEGSKILCASANEECDIWGVSTDEDKEFDVTSDAGVEIWPAVSPDGRTLVFQSTRSEEEGKDYVHSSISNMPLGEQGRTLRIARDGFDPCWLPDGKTEAFLRTSGGMTNIWTVDAGGGGERQITTLGALPSSLNVLPYNRTKSYNWSPDGNTVAYSSLRSGASNLYVASRDGTAERNLTNNSDPLVRPGNPLWSSDGARLSYVSYLDTYVAGQSRMWSVSVESAEVTDVVFKSETEVVTLGWSAKDGGLILAQAADSPQHTGPVIDVRLVEIRPNGEAKLLRIISSAYLINIALSPDGGSVAAAARLDGADNIWLFQLNGGLARKVTNNKDPRLYISGLSWSPDGRAIYFGRQANTATISIVDFPK